MLCHNSVFQNKEKYFIIVILKIKSVKQISQHFKATEPYLQMKSCSETNKQKKQLNAKVFWVIQGGKAQALPSQAPLQHHLAPS